MRFGNGATQSPYLSTPTLKSGMTFSSVLTEFRFFKSEIMAPGGGKSEISGKIDKAFYKRGWAEREYKTKFSVDDIERDDRTHLIDCAKNGVGLEIEWNSTGSEHTLGT